MICNGTLFITAYTHASNVYSILSCLIEWFFSGSEYFPHLKSEREKEGVEKVKFSLRDNYRWQTKERIGIGIGGKTTR